MSFSLVTPDEAARHTSRVVIADRNNRAAETVTHSADSPAQARDSRRRFGFVMQASRR